MIKPLLILLDFCIFFFSNGLTHMVNFLFWVPSCYSHIPSLLDLFISFETSNCLQWLCFNGEIHVFHVVFSGSIGFPSYSKGDALFYCTVYQYSCADWDSLRGHLRDVLWEDIFKLGSSAAGTAGILWVVSGWN